MQRWREAKMWWWCVLVEGGLARFVSPASVLPSFSLHPTFL